MNKTMAGKQKVKMLEVMDIDNIVADRPLAPSKVFSLSGSMPRRLVLSRNEK